MKSYLGVWRKIASLPLSTMLVGWVVYLVGFCLAVTSQGASSDSQFDYIAHYISVAAPLLVVLLASLHGALFGCSSLTFGFIAALLSVVCFPAVGHVLLSNAAMLYGCVNDFGSDGVEMKSVISSTASMVGCLLMSLSWTAVLVIWNGLTYKNAEEDDSKGTAMTPSFVVDIVCYAGVPRKLVTIFLFLQLTCWCRFIADIDDQVNMIVTSFYSDVPEVFLDFDIWVVFIVGLLIVISALIHAAVKGEVIPEFGAFTSLLSMLYLTCAGHLIFSYAIVIYHHCVDEDISIWAYPFRYQLYQLSSGIGTCIFWGAVLGLQRFYYVSTPPNSRSISPADAKLQTHKHWL